MSNPLSVRAAVAHGNLRNLYLPPTVPDALPDIPEGQENLLPIAILGDDLRIEFPRWDEAPEDRETLELFWNGMKVAEKSWPGAVPDNDLFILLPAAQLYPGVHTLHYRVTNWLGNPANSEPTTVTIDVTPPFYPAAPGQPRFDPEVELVGITRRYLENHDNQVEMTIPTYDYQPGDRVEVHWEEGGPFGDNRILEQDLPPDRKLYLDGDLIAAEGNGQRVVSYYLFDRAGNKSILSAGRTLKVDIAPPQLRPYPWVVDAQPGNPGSLDPKNFTSGVTVRVPEQTDIADSSTVTVHWRGFGDLGSYVASAPGTVGGWDFKIPASALPANFRRGVEVVYSVAFDEGEPEVSEVYRLSILAGPTTKIGCAQSSGTRISLAAIPAAGADLNLPPWAFKPVAEGMRVNIWMTGIDAQNQPVRHDVLVGAAVAMDREPVTTKMARAAFLTLKLNAVFRLHAEVSFDEGESYQGFQGLDLNLTA